MAAKHPTRSGPLAVTFLIGVILLFWFGVSVWLRAGHERVEADPGPTAPYTLAGRDTFPVHVQLPAGPPRVVVQDAAHPGGAVTVSCTTCHATRPPEPAHGLKQPVDEFHQDLVFNHGVESLACLSCHNPNDYDTLRTANGDALPYQNVMNLCAQCHSGQHRDYQHGAHGGMNGHWDLSQGPRTRNSCIDCHDPHAPAFPMMRPTFKPIDRGLNDSPKDASTWQSHE